MGNHISNAEKPTAAEGKFSGFSPQTNAWHRKSYAEGTDDASLPTPVAEGDVLHRSSYLDELNLEIRENHHFINFRRSHGRGVIRHETQRPNPENPSNPLGLDPDHLPYAIR